MVAKYSQSNIEAMIISVHSNREIIDSMLKRTAENEKNISRRLSEYSHSGNVLESASIDMYREYMEERENAHKSLEEYKNEFSDSFSRVSIELYKGARDYSLIHSILDGINTLQIKIMEMLCSLIGSSNKLLGCL